MQPINRSAECTLPEQLVKQIMRDFKDSVGIIGSPVRGRAIAYRVQFQLKADRKNMVYTLRNNIWIHDEAIPA